jgi:hypothetical protein
MNLTSRENLKKTSYNQSTVLTTLWKTLRESKIKEKNGLSHCRPASKTKKMHSKREWTVYRDRVRLLRLLLTKTRIKMKLSSEKTSWSKKCGAITTNWKWTKRWTVPILLKMHSIGSALKLPLQMFKKSYTNSKLVSKRMLISFKLSVSKNKGLKSWSIAQKINQFFFKNFKWSTIL